MFFAYEQRNTFSRLSIFCLVFADLHLKFRFTFWGHCVIMHAGQSFLLPFSQQWSDLNWEIIQCYGFSGDYCTLQRNCENVQARNSLSLALSIWTRAQGNICQYILLQPGRDLSWAGLSCPSGVSLYPDKLRVVGHLLKHLLITCQEVCKFCLFSRFKYKT